MQAWQATVQDEFGNVIFNPVITVYEEDGTTLASIYNENGTAKANPFNGTMEGFAQFWADAGTYKIVGSAPEGETAVWEVTKPVPYDDMLAGLMEQVDIAEGFAEDAADSADAATVQAGIATTQAGLAADAVVDAQTIVDGLDAPAQTIYYAFVEPYRDTTENVQVTWVSDSPSGTVMEYRPDPTGRWTVASSIRSRPFYNVASRWLHTARISGLGADCVYNIRWPGASLTDTFKTPPRANVKCSIGSDYHQFTFGDTSVIAHWGQRFATEGCDVAIFSGDYINDDGRWDTLYTTRWYNFLQAISKHWRKSGHMVPMAFLMGNHEGMGASGTGGALWMGNGTIGPIGEFLSLGYDKGDPDYVGPSQWAFNIGGEVGWIGIQTDHVSLLENQLGWLKERLAEMNEKVKHINVTGHAPAFCTKLIDWERYPTQARELKRSFWPAMGKYGSKIRGYWCGHEHAIAVTARTSTSWLEGATPTDNDRRWYRDNIYGVRQIGSGTMGGETAALVPGVYNETSIFDGSAKTIAALGYEDGVFSTYGSASSAGKTDAWNIWIATYGDANFNAKCIDRTGSIFVQVNEAIPVFGAAAPNAFLYDIAVTTSLFQDRAGTIPVASSGDPVRCIKDLSGQGRHAILYADATATPTYNPGSGKPYIDIPTGAGYEVNNPIFQRNYTVVAGVRLTGVDPAGNTPIIQQGGAQSNSYVAMAAAVVDGKASLNLTAAAGYELEGPTIGTGSNYVLTMRQNWGLAEASIRANGGSYFTATGYALTHFVGPQDTTHIFKAFNNSASASGRLYYMAYVMDFSNPAAVEGVAALRANVTLP